MKHHRSTKDKKCDVLDCENFAERSLPTGKIEEAIDEELLDFKIGEPKRRTHLCKVHYKAYKKVTKTDRDINRVGWGH